MNPFVEQHQDEIGCVLSCFDRVVITGTLPDICHPKAMAGYLRGCEIRPPDRYRTGVRYELAYTVLVSLVEFKRLPRESSIKRSRDWFLEASSVISLWYSSTSRLDIFTAKAISSVESPLR